MRFSAVAAAMMLLTFSAPARADIAADVRDIRAGKLPLRFEWLGWDASESAHVRELVCSDGGTTTCNAAFVEGPPDRPQKRRNLLSLEGVYCGTSGACEAVDARSVARATAAETSALAALPSRTITSPVTPTHAAFGPVAGDATTIGVRLLDTSTPDNPGGIAQLVARGKGGAIEVLGNLERTWRIESSNVDGAFISPSGRAAAFVVRMRTGVMCWDFDALHVVSIDLPRRRASLANTIGFRAWKRRDFPAALHAFTEATATDPSFAWGWFNRAAVESRTGDIASARRSFDRAVDLDASHAERACRDRDFDALRADDPKRFACTR